MIRATTDRSDAKGRWTKKAGADLVINTQTDDFVEKVKEWTNGLGADVVIDHLGGDLLGMNMTSTTLPPVMPNLWHHDFFPEN